MKGNRVQWYTIYIMNAITRQWEKIAEIKSPGLANIFIGKLHEIYGVTSVRTIEGKNAKLPKLMPYL